MCSPGLCTGVRVVGSAAVCGDLCDVHNGLLQAAELLVALLLQDTHTCCVLGLRGHCIGDVACSPTPDRRQ